MDKKEKEQKIAPQELNEEVLEDVTGGLDTWRNTGADGNRQHMPRQVPQGRTVGTLHDSIFI